MHRTFNYMQRKCYICKDASSGSAHDHGGRARVAATLAPANTPRTPRTPRRPIAGLASRSARGEGWG